MTDTTRAGADLDVSYLYTWTEPDTGQHRTLTEQMWASHGPPHVSSPALTATGTADTAERINHVHNNRVAGQGLTFSYDQHMESDDALLLRWPMTVPGGDVVGRGANTVLRDVDGKVARAYMFTDVN